LVGFQGIRLFDLRRFVFANRHPFRENASGTLPAEMQFQKQIEHYDGTGRQQGADRDCTTCFRGILRHRFSESAFGKYTRKLRSDV